MPWALGTFTRTNGTYTGATVWFQDNANGFNIIDTRHDTHDQDLAVGINTCLTKDGQNTPTANLPMGNFIHTGVGNASARTNYASAGQVADGGLLWGGTSSGSSNVYAISLTPAITAYVAGQAFRFLSHQTNTAASTINVNGAGAVNITKNGATSLSAGDILNGEIITVMYDGTQFQLLNRVSSGRILIETKTVSGGAEIVFNSTEIVGFSIYEIEGRDLSGASSSTFEFQGSIDNGSAYVNNSGVITKNSGGTVTGLTTANLMIDNFPATASTARADFSMNIAQPGSTGQPGIRFSAYDGGSISTVGASRVTSTVGNNLNNIRFRAASGNMSGTISLYGIPT